MLVRRWVQCRGVWHRHVVDGWSLRGGRDGGVSAEGVGRNSDGGRWCCRPEWRPLFPRFGGGAGGPAASTGVSLSPGEQRGGDGQRAGRRNNADRDGLTANNEDEQKATNGRRRRWAGSGASAAIAHTQPDTCRSAHAHTSRRTPDSRKPGRLPCRSHTGGPNQTAPVTGVTC